MIRTTNQKTETVPKELPPGWKWDTLAKEKLKLGYRAICPIEGERCLQTLCFPTEQEAITSAHEVERARQEGLVGLSGKGLVSRSSDAEEDGLGFHPGFPPGFDPERAEKGLAQEDKTERACRVCGCTDMDCRQCVEKTGEPCHWVEEDLCSACVPADAVAERLHKEAVARWRREKSVDGSESANGYHPQMLRMIPINNIEPSPTNPRKHFDPQKLQELADSIIEHGLVEPILVRPVEKSFLLDDCFQLVAGERRWRAAKIAGLTQIEAKVRDLDDKAVLEIQFIENLQRADLSAIEEAEGYKRLLDEHGYTADGLAAKLGKSKSYVYGRLKLCALPPAAMDAVERGDLPATIGELIGRLPSMEMREQFWNQEFEDYDREWFEMPSFREVKETIERRFMRELKGSPFSQTDGKLIPGVPSCAKCPKKTGNDRANYPDGRADLCTDVPCFQAKVQAHVEREAEKAKRAGANVLDEAETKKIFQGTENKSWLTNEGRKKYFESDDEPWQTSDDRKYKDLLDGHMTPVVAVDPQGESHVLYPRAEAEKILKGVHGIKPEAQRNHDTYKDSEKKRQEEKKLRQTTAAEIVASALLHTINGNPFKVESFLRVVAKFLIDKGGADVARAIAKRRDLKYDPNNVRGSVEGIVKGLDDADVPGLIVEWLLQRELEYWAQWGSESEKFTLCEYFGLKPNVLMKQVAAKAKEAAKKKPKAKVKAAAGA